MGRRRLASDRRGVTSVEYVLIGALIFLAIVTAIEGYTGRVSNLYNNFSTAIGAKL